MHFINFNSYQLGIKCSNRSASVFVNFSHFIEYVVISQKGFNLHFSDDLKLNTFSYVYWPFGDGLCEVPFQECILLLNCLCLFFSLISRNSFYILGMRLLSTACIANVFSYYVVYLSLSSIVSSDDYNFLTLM